MLKTRRLFSFFVLAIGLYWPIASQAFTARSGSEIVFGTNDKLDGTTYVAAERIVVDAPLPGDLICAGQSVVINQPVGGDVICAATNLTIKAKIDGNVRLIGSSVNLDGQVGRNVMVFGSEITLDNKTEIAGETLVAGQFLDSRGHYSQTVHGFFSRARLSGQYGAPVSLMVGGDADRSKIIVGQGAQLDKGLTYTANQAVEIDSSAKINGEVVKKDWPKPSHREKRDLAAGWLWGKALGLFMILATGLVVVSLWSKAGQNLVTEASQKPVKLSLQGLLVLIVMPIAALILACTIIGLPLAAIVLATWILLIYLAKLVIGYWLGKKLLPKVKNSLWQFLVGASIIVIVTWIPFVGWLLSAIATWWGVGAIWQATKKSFN